MRDRLDELRRAVTYWLLCRVIDVLEAGDTDEEAACAASLERDAGWVRTPRPGIGGQVEPPRSVAVRVMPGSPPRPPRPASLGPADDRRLPEDIWDHQDACDANGCRCGLCRCSCVPVPAPETALRATEPSETHSETSAPLRGAQDATRRWRTG